MRSKKGKRFLSKSIRIGFRCRISKLASSRAQLRRFALLFVASATCFSRLCGGAGVDLGSKELINVLSISVTRCSAIRVLIDLHSHSRSYLQL